MIPMDELYEYEKVSIQLELKCLSAMHIGSGEALEINSSDRDSYADKSNNLQEICLDSSNKPYIPASTLRGYLSRQITEQQDRQAIFGTASDADAEQAAMSKMGKLRVYDASTKEQQPLDEITTIITRNSIDDVTATVKNHHLYSQRYVNKGIKFIATLECDKCNKDELDRLLAAILSLNGKVAAQLGKGKTLMNGRLSASELSVKALHKTSFLQWLTSNEHINAFYKELNIQASLLPSANSHFFDSYALQFFPTSPLLINDTTQVSGKSGEPNLVFMHENKHVLIPSSSLKGLLRACCRKILLTMMGLYTNKDEPLVDTMIGQIFGDKDRIGLIRIDNALSISKATLHEQIFIAIDRFTGGVSNGALYMAKAAVVEQLDSVIYMHKELAQYEWAKGLLYLVLRDAMEGDLALGWGKAKGYGAFTLSCQANSWAEFYKQKKTQIQQAVKALESKLELELGQKLNEVSE